MSDETHEEEGFWIEFYTNYVTDPETDTEPIIHIYSENVDSDGDKSSTEILQLSLLDNKIIWKDPTYEVNHYALKKHNDFLKSPCKDNPSITIWEYFCNDWKKYHDIEFPKKQPNYAKIKKGGEKNARK